MPSTFMAAVLRGTSMLAAFTVLFLAPAQERFGWPVWKLPATSQLQSLWGPCEFLLAMTAISLLPRPKRWWLRSMAAASVTSAVFIAGWLLLRLVPDVPQSGKLMIAGLAGAVLFTMVDAVVGAWRWPVVAATLAVMTNYIVEGRRVSASEDFVHEAQQVSLAVRVHRLGDIAAPLATEGGGLASLGRGDALLVTGSGVFAHVQVDTAGAANVRRLPLTDPRNRAAFAAEVGVPVNADWFRVGDVSAERRGDRVVVHAVHHFWRSAERCLVVRVSRTTASSDLREWTAWTPVFDAEPCIRITAQGRGLPFVGSQMGGRLVAIPEGLLVSIGDHQHDGLNTPDAVAQDSLSQYGKIMLLPNDGGAPVLWSLGHRNPQGLARDSAGRIWASEHGPRGGDELNLIERGANYGWPYRTHGAEYGLRAWPLLRPASAAFREPSQAWVPSIGISSILVPSPTAFPEWRGDLLVGALKGKALYRVHLDENRPVYTELITMGFEIRDMDLVHDGMIVLWTDEGALLTMRAERKLGEAESAFAPCVSCHSISEGQLGGIAPNLHGVVGRTVASLPNYPYSAALAGAGGTWTRERLSAFLANPSAFAPGTAMGLAGIADSTTRERIIDYLENAERITRRR